VVSLSPAISRKRIIHSHQEREEKPRQNLFSFTETQSEDEYDFKIFLIAQGIPLLCSKKTYGKRDHLVFEKGERISSLMKPGSRAPPAFIGIYSHFKRFGIKACTAVCQPHPFMLSRSV
jgi:hypothetical protein